MDKFVGKRIDGRYEIQEIIGVGGMAVVYKARDNQENRTVAVKILKEEFTSNEEFLRRFKNESKAIAMLSHPNIVNVYDVSFGDLIQYIVMEYIDGITLKEYIERQGSLRWNDAVHFTVQILKGLQHAHDKGIVHRDVKPQNIIVLPDGTIKVTDFGIARFARSDQRTITDKAIGSVHYISPEQARGEKTDEKADVYSVGVMLYEMLTGKLPFQAESAVSVAIMQLQRDPQLPSEINSSIPLGLEQITMHAMQKTVERRYQSAAEMLCDLVSFRKDPALTFEYSYFVDDSPTRYVGEIPVVTPSSVEETEAEETAEEEKKQKNFMIPVLAGVATTLVIVLIVLAIIFLPKLFSSTPEAFECKNFVGMSWTEEIQNSEYEELYDFEVKWEPNSEYEHGEIFKQSITPGSSVKEGVKITIYVSLGEDLITLDDYTGKPYLEAKKDLELLGFEVKVEAIESDEYEVGMVVKTDPAAKTQVVKGSKITIYAVLVEEEKKIEVPDVRNYKKQDAIDELENEGFEVVIEEVYLDLLDSQQPLGYVVEQDNVGEELSEGSKIKIHVAVGYEFDIKVDLTMVEGLDQITLYKVKLLKDGSPVSGYGDEVLGNATYTFKGVKTTNRVTTYSVHIEGIGEICTVTATAGEVEPVVTYK